jgi:uncharacterized protein YcfJ
VTTALTSYVRRLLGAFSDTTPNPRTVPEDLLRLRPATAYVIAPCNRTGTAESVARKLLDFGFERSELVLVSNRVHTLRPYPDQDTLEVVDSLRVARQSGSVAGVATGACFGALFGILLAGVTLRTTGAYAVGAFAGGLLGAAIGVALGRSWAGWLRRRPDAIYDEQLDDDQILIGVGIGERAPEGRADDAVRLLKEAGLEPRLVSGEDAQSASATGAMALASRA